MPATRRPEKPRTIPKSGKEVTIRNVPSRYDNLRGGSEKIGYKIAFAKQRKEFLEFAKTRGYENEMKFAITKNAMAEMKWAIEHNIVEQMILAINSVEREYIGWAIINGKFDSLISIVKSGSRSSIPLSIKALMRRQKPTKR